MCQYIIYGVAAFFFVYAVLLLGEGFYTTSAIKKELQSDFKTTVCGRCITAFVRPHPLTCDPPPTHTQPTKHHTPDPLPLQQHMNLCVFIWKQLHISVWLAVLRLMSRYISRSAQSDPCVGGAVRSSNN